MRVAIVSTMPHHFECIPPFADLVETESSFLDIYLLYNDLNWLNYLQILYRENPRVSIIFGNFTPNLYALYDYIIAPTEVDEVIPNLPPRKTIALQHCVKQVSGLSPDQIFTTRQFPTNAKIFFPVSSCIIRDVKHKQFVYDRPAWDDKTSILIAIVGSPQDFDTSIVLHIHSQYPLAKFVLIGSVSGLPMGSETKGKPIKNLEDVPNLKYGRVSADKLYWYVTCCDYVLMNKVANYYNHDVMSGTLPLSHTCLTPLIMSRIQFENFPFLKSAILYDEKGLEPGSLRKSSPQDWQALLEERRAIMRQNREALNLEKKANAFPLPTIHLVDWENPEPSAEIRKRAKQWESFGHEVRISAMANVDAQKAIIALVKDKNALYIDSKYAPNVAFNEWPLVDPTICVEENAKPAMMGSAANFQECDVFHPIEVLQGKIGDAAAWCFIAPKEVRSATSLELNLGNLPNDTWFILFVIILGIAAMFALAIIATKIPGKKHKISSR